MDEVAEQEPKSINAIIPMTQNKRLIFVIVFMISYFNNSKINIKYESQSKNVQNTKIGLHIQLSRLILDKNKF
jgi:hypothetical protein